MHNVLKRILEQWDGIAAYAYSCSGSDVTAGIECTRATLANPVSKLYITFLKGATGDMNSFNKLFQAESSIIFDMHTQLMDAVRAVLRRVMQHDAVMELGPSELLSLDVEDAALLRPQ
jgi:hypothetical protein